MNLDSFLYRKQLKRQITFWRAMAIITAVVLVIVSVGGYSNLVGSDQIAILRIKNIITNDPSLSKALNKVAHNNSIKALLIYINSPGGTVAGGETLYSNIRQIAEKKPVVTIMGDYATSASYMVAIAAEKIFARRSTITGSIGVVLQTADVTELLKKVGIKPYSIKSSPLKAQPNPLEKMSEDARIANQRVVSEIYNMFVNMIAERRKISKEEALKLADGRVYTGQQALKKGLIDAIGGERDALKWLQEAKNLSANLPLKTIVLDHDGNIMRKVTNTIFGETFISERLRLDGLISLWQPNSW